MSQRWHIEKDQRVVKLCRSGEHGTVLSVAPSSFIVTVRWDSGYVGEYWAQWLRQITPLEALAHCGE